MYRNISIIVPTRNRANILQRVINSIENQNYIMGKYELIIVDNGSNDNTKEIVVWNVERAKICIRYLYEPKLGTYYARRLGVLAAKYELLAFTDDDCLPCKNWLFELNNGFNLDKRIIAVGGKINVKWDRLPNKWIVNYLHLLGKLDRGRKIVVREQMLLFAGNLSVYKSTLIKIGGFNPGLINLKCVGDEENGLCEKLGKIDGYLLWTPGAIVNHMQRVGVNDTFMHIMRKYMNIGINLPFKQYYTYKLGKIAIVKTMIQSLFIGVCSSLVKVFIKRDRKRRIIFESMFNLVRVPFCIKVLVNKKMW